MSDDQKDEDAIRASVLTALIDSKMEFAIEDEADLFLFFANGMRSYGPNVETVTMPVKEFVACLRVIREQMQTEIGARAAMEQAMAEHTFPKFVTMPDRRSIAVEAVISVEVDTRHYFNGSVSTLVVKLANGETLRYPSGYGVDVWKLQKELTGG